jgi:berberine-like enzyme
MSDIATLDRAHAAAFGRNLERLSTIKAAYDPGTCFGQATA